MSRSGYVDCWDGDDGTVWLSMQAVVNAIKGKRGQAFLREMRDALDSMPQKRLIPEELVRPDGEVCAMGSVCARRGIDVSDIDPEDHTEVAKRLGLAPSMVREIAFHNDDDFCEIRDETPEERWVRMRAWVDRQIVASKP